MRQIYICDYQILHANAAPLAPPIALTSTVEHIRPIVSISSTLATGGEAVAHPPPTLPVALTSDIEAQGASLTNAIVSETVGGRHGAGAGHLCRDIRSRQTMEDTAGSSNKAAGPSGTRGTVAAKKQSKYWTYVLEPVPAAGPADTMTNDGTSTAPSRKLRWSVKADVDAGGTGDASIKEPRKKKQKRT